MNTNPNRGSGVDPDSIRVDSCPFVVRQLPLLVETPRECNAATLQSLLSAHGRLTRKQIGRLTGWKDREIRDAAEASGSEVIRDLRGFVLFHQATLDEAEHAARIAHSQAVKMLRYSQSVRRRLHARI